MKIKVYAIRKFRAFYLSRFAGSSDVWSKSLIIIFSKLLRRLQSPFRQRF